MIKHTTKKIAMTSIFALSMVASAAITTQTYAMSPFKADYQFNYNGKNLGSNSYTQSKW